jgi:hypothetical protein
MKFQISRHARRRIRLYRIDLQSVESSILARIRQDGIRQNVRITYIDHALQIENQPLKIVYVVERETITIVSVYPLKKGRNP